MVTTETNVLTGFRVVDLTNAVAGASATMLLGAMGAEIVKVESLGSGDFLRARAPYIFESCNRFKRSIALDLKDPNAVEVVRALASTSDVFVQSMRPGAMRSLGLSRDELTALNSRLIYASFSAFGETGTKSERRGIDPVIQAESGMANNQGFVTGSTGTIDTIAGLAFAHGIVGALLHRERTGTVRHVESDLMSTALYMQGIQIAESSGGNPAKTTEKEAALAIRYPTSGTFMAADAAFFIAQWDPDWGRLCELLGRADLATDVRYTSIEARSANAAEVRKILEQSFKSRPRHQWIDGLQRIGIMAGELRTYPELLADTQLWENGTLERISTSEHGQLVCATAPYRVGSLNTRTRPAPPVGADTSLVLAELGWDAKRQEDLRRSGAIG